MKRLVAALLVALTVAACGGGGGTPAPSFGPPPPPAASVPEPGPLALDADLSSPLGPVAICGGSPFACQGPPGAVWGMLQASDAAKFSTSADGLGFATGSGVGMAIGSTSTVSRSAPLSVRAVVRVDSLDDCHTLAYLGPVAYGGGVDDGDPTGRYRAEYLSCLPGDPTVRVWLYSPTYAGVMPGSPAVALGVHTLREDWYPGDHVDYFLDDESRPLFTEDASFGHDPLGAPHDLHPFVWIGSAAGAVLSLRAYGAPPTP